MTVTSPPNHPLRSALFAALAGRFPAVDGRVEVVPPDDAGTQAVVEFTGHSFVLTDLSAHDELFVGVDAFGGATQPRVLTELAGPNGTVGSLDLVMVRRAGPHQAEPLHPIGDTSHPRIVRAHHHRRDVTVLGDDSGVVTLGRGLVDRREISIELTDAAHGHGVGRRLVSSALATLDPDEFVFAQVAPGNAASVRMFFAAGFVPIGCEVLIERCP